MPGPSDPAREAEAAARKTRGAGMTNVEITDATGTRRVLMARFPRRAKIATGTAVVTVIVLGLPLLFLLGLPLTPEYDSLEVAAAIVVLAIAFGWYFVLLFITAWRGGFLALTETGVLVETGLSSVLIPWADIKAVQADVEWQRQYSNPVLRLSIRRGAHVSGWPWPAAISPVLFGSWGRNLRILAWWFQPVPLDAMVSTIRYLASHPDERDSIGIAEPDAWIQASARRRAKSQGQSQAR